MSIETVIPWETPDWDGYVNSHPSATMYHTSAWCRIVAETGRYTPMCLAHTEGGRVRGVLPIMEVRSRLTGNRIGSLPFSDSCCALADDAATADGLIAAARALVDERGVSFYEMRGAPALRDGTENVELAGFSRQTHFAGYHIEMTEDTAAIRRTFSRNAVHRTINQGLKRGVAVRRGGGPGDLGEFYRLYVLNRTRHGIPPQPLRLFERIFELMPEGGGGPEGSDAAPEARLYMAELDGEAVAAIILLRYRHTAYARYQGIDESARRARPIYPLIWATIEDSALSGYTRYDFGRTALDNPGLNDFKRRWGTVRTEIPYFFCPPAEGLSTVGSDSLKYRLFTSAFRRLPPALAVRVGARIFRHFG